MTQRFRLVVLSFALWPGLLQSGQVDESGPSITGTVRQTVEALSDDQRTLFNQITDNLRCPTCNGMSVRQSDAPFSDQIKRAVAAKVKDGDSEQDIIRFFRDRYGPWILRAPPTEGFHWLAWLLPVLLGICGVAVIGWRFWRSPSSQRHLAVRGDSEILSEMGHELRRRREAAC